jgi:hypothetical protein
MRFFWVVTCIMSSFILGSCKKNNITNLTPVIVDSFTVMVNNGYGSGKYKIGDTVHILPTIMPLTNCLINGLAMLAY